MKYKVLIGSVVCFLMSGVVVGSDEGMTSRKFANLITRQGKASDELDRLKHLHPGGGPLVDAAEKKAEKLEEQLAAVFERASIIELIKEAILGGKKTSETAVKYCFNDHSHLLKAAWKSIGEEGRFTPAIIKYCISTCIPDDGNEDQHWIRTYCHRWLDKNARKCQVRVVVGLDGEVECESDGGESSDGSVHGTDDDDADECELDPWAEDDSRDEEYYR